jgi:hypothetical protein
MNIFEASILIIALTGSYYIYNVYLELKKIREDQLSMMARMNLLSTSKESLHGFNSLSQWLEDQEKSLITLFTQISGQLRQDNSINTEKVIVELRSCSKIICDNTLCILDRQLSQEDFDKYINELKEKDSLVQETLKKIKENRLKTMKIAFGGKEDEK